MSPRISEALVIRGKTLRNRIIMPPLVCFNWGDDDGMETVSRAEHYGRRARGGVGLIIVEATAVSREGRLHQTELGLWSDQHIPQFRRIAEACHAHGVPVIVQLVHAGSKAVGPDRVSSSAVADEVRPARAMSEAEIQQFKQDYLRAAQRAAEAGLDGIEIHGAHGYLLSQFSSAQTNQRSDDYGGSLPKRQRLPLELATELRRSLPVEFILGYRFGVNDPSLQEDLDLAGRLIEAGVDMLNVSAGIGADSLTPPADFAFSPITWMGVAMKAALTAAGHSVPVACVFGITRPEQAKALLDGNQTDLVAVGRGLLADPDWTNKAL
ncbi:MAG: NADH:flavin oxidoreductase, partial [Spirochaetes bacterium]|nr:NADH:flavin oxidoreductase [Spirochaetota bacterium]